MPDDRDVPAPPRSPDGYEDRPGRSGPDVGDDAGGQGAEFAGDAAVGAGDDPVSGESYLKAHGHSAGDR